LKRNKDKLIKGFDYLKQKPVELTKKEWQEFMKGAVAGGGFRRGENKETFIHGNNSRIIAEIYEVIY